MSSPGSSNPPVEPEEGLKTNTTLSAETESLLVVLETRLEPTAQVDPGPCEELSIVLQPETAPVMRPDTAPDPLPADQTEPDSQDNSAEVEVTSQNSHPDLGSLETVVGSQSTVPSPRRGTRLRDERYALIRRIQVLPVNQAQDGPSVCLFTTIGVAVTLSAALPVAPLTSE